MTQWCALATKRTNHILRCFKHTQPAGQKLTLLLYLVLVQPHLEYCAQFWAQQNRKDVKVFESIQRRETNLVKGLEDMSCEERLRTPGLPSLEKRRLRGDPTALCNSLRRGSTEVVQPLLLSPMMGCMRTAHHCARGG